MLQRSIALLTIVSVLMLLVLVTTTSPANAGPVGILGFFVFMYGAALGVLTFLFRFLGMVLIKIVPKNRMRALLGQGVTFRKSYYYATVAASIPVMVMAMQTVGEIGIYQILLIIFFVVVAWIFVANRTS